MARETASNEMEQQKSYEPDTAANRFSTCPNNYSDSPNTSLALRTHRTRSATPSVNCSASSVSAPKEPPGDPLGSGSLRGVGLRPGRTNRRLSPGNSTVPIVGNQEDNAGCVDESVMADVIDYLPREVAKTVINMQQYYATGVEELTGKLGIMDEEVRAAREENEELRRRLDMHFVMLRQANKFMQSVRNGSFGGVERADVPTLVEEGDEEDDDDDVPMRSVDMELPPTPVVDREPVRSTGRKATKRRPGAGSYGPRRGGKGQKKVRRVSTEESAVNSKGSTDAKKVQQTEVSSLEKLREKEIPQESHHYEGGADGEDEDDDGLKILAGAPRLQALLRKSAWTAINNRQNDTDPNADYRPCSPASASESSSPPSPSVWSSPSPSPLPPRTPSRNKTTTPTKSSSAQSQSSRPRYSTPRHTTIPRYASGPKDRPFRFHRMGRTVLDIWKEYKHGWKGNPAIESLEKKYATGWRTGTLREIKYASNYVGVRHKVVSKVEEICEREGISPEEACRRLDERVDGRIQMLLSAVRKGKDPFEVIPKR